MTLFLMGGERNISHNASPWKGRTKVRIAFGFRAIFRWGLIFAEVCPLVLSQLTIMIAFYDLHKCKGQRDPSKSEFLQKRSPKYVVAATWGLYHHTAQGPVTGTWVNPALTQCFQNS